MKKMTPERCGIMARTATSRVTAQVASTARRCTARQPLPVMSSAGAENWPPALLTRVSMRPKRVERLVDHRGDLIVVANVDGQGERPRAHRFDLGGGLFQRLDRRPR